MVKNLQEIKLNFPRYFKHGFADFYDGILSVAFGQVMIDLPKFSTWLDAPDGVSDIEYIEQKFGKEAAAWFIKMFIEI